MQNLFIKTCIWLHSKSSSWQICSECFLKSHFPPGSQHSFFIWLKLWPSWTLNSLKLALNTSLSLLWGVWGVKGRLLRSTVKLFCAHIHRRRSDRECQCGVFLHAAAQHRQTGLQEFHGEFFSSASSFSSFLSCWSAQSSTRVQFVLCLYNIVEKSCHKFSSWRLWQHVSSMLSTVDVEGRSQKPDFSLYLKV